MSRSQAVRAVLVACIVFVAAVVPGMPASAKQGKCPRGTFCFEAGMACPGFALQIDVGEDSQSVYREFLDADGNVVRSIFAGTGYPLTFTNVSTGEYLSTEPNGAVSQTVYNPDGSSTTVSTGHNVLILFPTDVPAGPSTTLHVGQIVSTVGVDGVWTLVKTTGTSLDICAALSD
jgi:hypothetical protein